MSNTGSYSTTVLKRRLLLQNHLGISFGQSSRMTFLATVAEYRTYDKQESLPSSLQAALRFAYRPQHTQPDCHTSILLPKHKHHTCRNRRMDQGPGSHGMEQMVLENNQTTTHQLLLIHAYYKRNTHKNSHIFQNRKCSLSSNYPTMLLLFSKYSNGDHLALKDQTQYIPSLSGMMAHSSSASLVASESPSHGSGGSGMTSGHSSTLTTQLFPKSVTELAFSHIAKGTKKK